MSGSAVIQYRTPSDPSIIARLVPVSQLGLSDSPVARHASHASATPVDAVTREAARHEPDDDDASTRAYKFERRQCERFDVSGHASMIRVGGEHFGEIHDLKLIDYSQGGFGAFSDRPVEPGALVSIGFDMSGCIAKRGMVLSCRPCGHGYRVAVRFDRSIAA